MANEQEPRIELRQALRADLETKVEQLLASEQRFANGNKYGTLDLAASALAEWQDRPVIPGSIEPLVPRENLRIILIDQIAREIKTRKRRFLRIVKLVTTTPAFKNIQLHITPLREAPRVRYVYDLILVEGKPEELSYYMDKPAGISVGDEPAPMLPFGTRRMEATINTLQVFNKFLDQAKLVEPY